MLEVNSQPVCCYNKDNKDKEITITAIITLPNKVCKGDHFVLHKLSLDEAVKLRRNLTKAIREAKKQ